MNGTCMRVAVVGSAGSGKTTLAETLSGIGQLHHSELDVLRYERDWEPVADQLFRNRVDAICRTNAWIIDGNYAVVRDLILARAQLVVWLDYSLPMVLWRLLRRTVLRLIRREEIGQGNRESLARIFGRRSILLWTVRSHSPLRTEYERALIVRARPGQYVKRLRTPKATASWVMAQRSRSEGDVRDQKFGGLLCE